MRTQSEIEKTYRIFWDMDWVNGTEWASKLNSQPKIAALRKQKIGELPPWVLDLSPEYVKGIFHALEWVQGIDWMDVGKNVDV